MNPACTAEAAILHTFVEILNATLRPLQFWCTYHPFANKRQCQHWGRREEAHTGKSWLKRGDKKKPHFPSSVSTKFEEYCSYYFSSHNGSCYHRIAWKMLFYSRRSARFWMRRTNYNYLNFHYLIITSGKIFKAAFNTNTKPLKPMPSVDSYTLLKIIAPINIEKIFRIP